MHTLYRRITLLVGARSASVESDPRRHSSKATGVVMTSANLGSIIGITLTSAALEDNADLNAFRTIFILHLTTSLLGTLIRTHVEP